jgi:hypothetical protein
MHRYCTLFDRNYLPRGLALHRSLMRYGANCSLHVLCLDEVTRDTLARLDLPRVELVSVGDLEDWDLELRAKRSGRTQVEYYFTCKPVLLAYLLERHPQAGRLSYLDSDLYFWSSADRVEQECAGSAIALTPHKFGPRNAHKAQYGKFNAGWVSIDTSSEALRFVQWWRERCLEWCRLVVEDTRFGDQKYLDQVPGSFPGAKVVVHPGVNAGPWNLDSSRVELSPGGVLIEKVPLALFHFHGLHRMLFGLYDSGLHEYGVELTPAIRRGIYEPYLSELARCERAIPAASRAMPTASPLRRLAQTARAVARHTAVSAAG